MKNIIFIGMPAVGKSTIGVVTAKFLGYDFLDTDLLIQKTEGRLLKDIIAREGQDGFLEIEDRVNVRVEAENSIIAPGGSVVYCENAMNHFREIGIVVYLKASYETISKRLGNAKDLYRERTPLFEKYADITVCEDGLSLDETIALVIETLKNAGVVTV